MPENQPGHFEALVPEGEDGKFWKIINGPRGLKFLNIPPYLARSPQELLLPKEVVESDRSDEKP
jgi:hypothetical protein